MRVIAIILASLSFAPLALGKDIMRIGASGTPYAETSGDAFFSTAGRRSITITPTATRGALGSSGSYSIDCNGGYRGGTFLRTVRVRLTGAPARCKIAVRFLASAPAGPDGSMGTVAVRVIVSLR